jgi:hypothetical protein
MSASLGRLKAATLKKISYQEREKILSFCQRSLNALYRQYSTAHLTHNSSFFSTRAGLREIVL